MYKKNLPASPATLCAPGARDSLVALCARSYVLPIHSSSFLVI